MYKVVSLHFTNDCNFNCPFCYREKGVELMDKELFLGLPRFLKDVTEQVALGGGEPTLYPDLVENFAKECRDYDLTCNLTTNGFIFREWNEEETERFCKDLTMVSVSLDKAKVWMDKLLADEIDLKTFKTGIDVLLPKKHMGDDIGYV